MGSTKYNPQQLKENSVKLVDNNYEAIDILKAISADIGDENIIGCVKTQGFWIITLKNKDDVQLMQETGVKIKEEYCTITGVTKTLLTVSFFGVPVFMDDYDITQKLEEYGCIIKSKWVRKTYKEFPNIENGIRFVRLELPNNAKSLPYAITVNKVHMRLLHNGQLRVCNLCLSEDHLMKECQYYRCRLCDEQGHTYNRCPNITCYNCGKAGHKSFQCEEVRNMKPRNDQEPRNAAPGPSRDDNTMETEVNTKETEATTNKLNDPKAQRTERGRP